LVTVQQALEPVKRHEKFQVEYVELEVSQTGLRVQLPACKHDLDIAAIEAVGASLITWSNFDLTMTFRERTKLPDRDFLATKQVGVNQLSEFSGKAQ
jgi:hypothetical protein